MEIRPDLNDRLIPPHVEHGDLSELSPDSTGVDQLAEDMHDSLNTHDPHSSGLVDKFRSSLRKKISIKGMAGLAKPPPRAGRRKPDDEAAEAERMEVDDGGDRSQNVEELEIERSREIEQELEETVETTTYSVEETVEVKKKKKKKRRPREEEVVEQEEIEVVESTPVKTGAVKLPDFAASPVVTMETEEISYEMTTEGQQSSSSGRAKKTKRKTHKKRTQQNDDDVEQVF